MRALSLCLLASLAASSSLAFADDEHETKKRPVPDYDGRGEEAPGAGDVLLYVPRVVLFPAYLVSEYVVRRPMEWLVINAEQGQWPSLVLDFFTFEDRSIGVFPTGLVDFGFRPSVGVYMFWNDFIVERNDIRFSAATGGSHYYTAHFTDRVRLPENAGIVAASFDYTRRPDYIFAGVGREPSSTFGRYRAERIEGLLRYDAALRDEVIVVAQAGVRRVAFLPGGCCGDPTASDLIAMGVFTPDQIPPDFGTDYTIYHHALEVDFDTRKPKPAPGSGLRVELSADQAFGLVDTVKSPWINYGGAIGGFLDVAGLNRVLSLFLSARFIDPTSSSKSGVPFTELLTLGGAGVMPGFRPGRLLGRSVVAAQLEYRWPIWVWLDGAMHFALGNVFGPQLDDFRWNLLRGSFGIGMRASGRRDQSFNVLIAAGTDTFHNGFAVTDFRFVFGLQRGF
jgi:hypothetical protein